MQIVGRRSRQVRLWVPRKVRSLEIHPPITQALDAFLEETGVDWRSESLAETDINAQFRTLRAPIPKQEIVMELGGPPITVQASALVAAGVRLGIAHSLLLQDIQNLRDARPELFRQQPPTAE